MKAALDHTKEQTLQTVAYQESKGGQQSEHADDKFNGQTGHPQAKPHEACLCQQFQAADDARSYGLCGVRDAARIFGSVDMAQKAKRLSG